MTRVFSDTYGEVRVGLILYSTSADQLIQRFVFGLYSELNY